MWFMLKCFECDDCSPECVWRYIVNIIEQCNL